MDQRTAKVTVGISFLNNEDTLESAVRSVFAQTMRNWELILVNDGSTDRSLEIVRGIRDPRVRVIDDGENRGLAARLNQITREASGEFIARMDADDVMHPERLEAQAEYLDVHQDVDVVGSRYYVIDGAERILAQSALIPLDTRPIAVLRKVVFLHPSCMGRRKWFEGNRYDESLLRAQDAELWIRTFRTSGFAQIERPLLFYRVSGRKRRRRDFLLKSFRGLFHHFRTVVRYGPPLVGSARAYLLIARIVGFHLVLTPLALLNRQAMLVYRRSPELDRATRAAAQSVLERVRETDVPGIRPYGCPVPDLTHDAVGKPA
jgi:glycosyltransferase involved in cell wall biosynthesis